MSFEDCNHTLTPMQKLVKGFVDTYLTLFPIDPYEAKAALVGSFLTIMSALEPKERELIKIALGYVMLRMGDEVFEDGPDFLSFLKEIAEDDFGKQSK